jgi:N-acetylmuramoyl-L-alanine amidase
MARLDDVHEAQVDREVQGSDTDGDVRVKREGDARDAERPMPCDLPLDERRGGAGRRRALIVVIAALAAIAVVLGAFVVFEGLYTGPASPVLDAARQGAQSLVGAAVSSMDDARGKAERGEGPVSGVVCIDAGHGGGANLTLTPIGPGSSEMQYVEPGGTAGVVTGVEEAQVTLQVALLLRDKLEDAGVTVVMVREDNTSTYSSEQRALVANAAGADLFVRLHCDGSENSSTRGFSTLVPGHNQWTDANGIVESSAEAAAIMHPLVVEEIGAVDAGIVERSDLAGFNFCEVPSVLFEMGFMSNPEEDVLLNDPDYQDLLASALCDATIAYLEAAEA